MIDLQASDVRPFLPSKDFAMSKDFYVALGCTIKWSGDDIALLEIANQHFYLQRAYAKEWAENTMLHLTVVDTQSCFTQITALLATGRFGDARIAPPKQQDYGALVTHLIDPAGVLLHLAQWNKE